MRLGRSKAVPGSEAGFYHCISRVVERRFAFGDAEKEHFVKLMRGYEAFCGVQIITYCVMSNHFHLLVKVPRRPDPADLPSDEELLERVKAAGYTQVDHGTLEQALERFRKEGQHAAAGELRERLFCRMWDVSWYMKMLKQRFTQWLNKREERRGTLWEERFRSVLVEGAGRALLTMATYIDLNPFRAHIVDEPADYRWSGYAEAAAGGRLAREGLRVALEAAASDGGSQKVAIEKERVPAEYRVHLHLAGEEKAVCSGENGARVVMVRRGFEQERIAAVLERGGELELCDAIRCRVRYFCDGVVLGSRAFVEAFFVANRRRFGKRRRSGARPLRGIHAPDLFSVRDLGGGAGTIRGG